jgi:glycosyltransferase A (GT-A) superfamily protein (DUF2064 family)
MLNRLQTLPSYDVELHTDVDTDAWLTPHVTRKLQTAGSLGLKMVHALESAVASGYDRAVILGSDVPTLPLAHVEYLVNSTADVALGPAEDGGFWGIGARQTRRLMLDEIIWSCPDTFDETVRAIEDAGLTVAVGPAWFDVDEPKDLNRLLMMPNLPPATLRWATRHRAIAARTTRW